MKLPEYDDPRFIKESNFDDRIISDDAFANVFGTPSSLIPLDKSRFSDSELNTLSKEDLLFAKSRCVKGKNTLGLRDLYTFFYVNDIIYKLGESAIAMAFLCARTDNIEDYNDILTQYPLSSRHVTPEIEILIDKLIRIGVKYPELNDSEMNFIEDLYHHPIFNVVAKDIFLDKEILPRQL